MKEKFIIGYLQAQGGMTPEFTIPDGWEIVDYQTTATGGNGYGGYLIVRIREVVIGAST